MLKNITISTRQTLFFLAILISFFVGCYENFPAFLSDYLKTDDARANIFWFHHLIDPELFADDYLTRYAIFYEATGTYYLYTGASFFMDPFLLEKLLPIILLTISGTFLFLIGNYLNGPYTGLVFTLLFVLFPNHNEIFNAGFSRTFAFPGAIIFLYLLITRRFIHLIWWMPFMALFYPIVFLLNAVTYSLWLTLKLSQYFFKPAAHNASSIKKVLLYFSLAIILSALVILPKYAVPNPEFGELLNYYEIIDDPGAYQYGRNHLLPPQLQHEKILLEIGHPFVIILGLWTLFGLGLSFFKRIPSEFWLYGLSGLLLYDLAYSLLLKLYFPYKYFAYSFSFVLFCILSFSIGTYIEQLPKLKQRLISLSILSLLGILFYGHNLVPARDMDDFSQQAFLYQHIQTLPKQSLIAANPYLADNIPLFGARAVLFNHELASPWFKAHSDNIRQRISDFYRAYYANNAQDIYKFMQKYAISHLLLDEKDFHELGRERFYINPFNDQIRRLVQTNQGKFFLYKNREALAQFRWQGFYLIHRQQIEESL